MFRVILVTSLLSALVNVDQSAGNPVTNEVICDKELMFAMVCPAALAVTGGGRNVGKLYNKVNRHGDRTPDADELSLAGADAQEAIRNATILEGLEGLTIMGKRRAYQLGKFLRLRYGEPGLKLISNFYLHDEIAVRSTDKERTKMTIQLAMAAAYPPEPEQQWDEYVGKVWQPVPYTAVPMSDDYLRFHSNCKRFLALMEEGKAAAVLEEFKVYDDLVPILKQNTGRNFTEDPLLYLAFHDLLKSMGNLGIDIPVWVKPLLPRLKEAAKLTYLLYFRNEEMKKIGGGVLLNAFTEAAEDIMSGRPVTQRLRLFSSHDFNVGAFMMVSKVISDYNIPDYGSMFALELYKSKNGEYSVLPVYLPVAGNSSPQELQISGCGSRCDYTKFRDLTKEYRLPESDYNSMCSKRTEL